MKRIIIILFSIILLSVESYSSNYNNTEKKNLFDVIDYFHLAGGIINWGYIGGELGVGFHNDLFMGFTAGKHLWGMYTGPNFDNIFGDDSDSWEKISDSLTLGAIIGYDFIKEIVHEPPHGGIKIPTVLGTVIRGQLGYFFDTKNSLYEPYYSYDTRILSHGFHQINLSVRCEVYLTVFYAGLGVGLQYQISGISASANKPFGLFFSILAGFSI